MKLKSELFASCWLAIALVLFAGDTGMQAIFAAKPQPAAMQPVPLQAPQRQGTPPAQQSRDVVPAEFFGDWVPAKGSCDSPTRFRVTGNQFTLINGQDSASYGDLHMSATYFGNVYNGVSKVVMPDSNASEPPFMAFFNHEEKKG